MARFVVDAPDRARVLVKGPDARAFIHRLSTQHVKDLQPGEARLNVFPTDKGRVVDLVHHLDRGERGILLIGSAGRGPSLYAWLDRYLFSEKVELVDMSGEAHCAEVIGEEIDLAPWQFRERDDVITVRTFDRVDRDGRRLPAALVIAQKPIEGERWSADEAEAARVAAGVPGNAAELVDTFNPLDLGLHDAIHWNKGCYIGQEVIARLDTYQKQAKRLVSLKTEAPIAVGAHVVVDGVTVGTVTSVAPVAWGDAPNAIAVAKLKELPASVTVASAATSTTATASLPLTAQARHD